jgi:aminopeptidase C
VEGNKKEQKANYVVRNIISTQDKEQISRTINKIISNIIKRDIANGVKEW